jgi:hypothetical protein
MDEVRNCMELFEKLNDSLTASWNLMYQVAKKYYETYGDLEVPKRYITEDGYSLGSWISTQRQVYLNRASGVLTPKQIEQLDAIGMRWEREKDTSWEQHFQRAKAYYEKHGDLVVSVNEELGQWLARLRFYRKHQIKSVYLLPERICALDEIGMIWDMNAYLWKQNYEVAKAYYESHGTLEGVPLGSWIANMKASYKKGGLTKEQVKKLEALGMVWEDKHKVSWEKSYEAACRYQKEHGDLKIPTNYISEEGIKLGRWIRHQKEMYPDRLSEERKRRLDSIGMVWKVEDAWKTKFRLVEKFYRDYGHTRISGDYVMNGVWIGKWLYEQIARLNGTSKVKKPLTEEQVKKLESVGIKKDVSRSEVAWEEQYQEAKKYFETCKNLEIKKGTKSSNGKDLGIWIATQRHNYQKGNLKEEQVERLEKIGMVWSMQRVKM